MKNNKYRSILVLSLIFLFSINAVVFSAITVKIRDIAYIDGLKENQIFGFGLVVGLQGTGDSKSALVDSSLKSLLKNVGIVEEGTYKSKNIAAVLLTCKLPPFVRVGDRLDVTVSSIGDARSLEGGILIQSPLMGGDGQVYVVSQGSLSFPTPAQNNKMIKTVAKVVNGGIVEREIQADFITNGSISLVLKDWDFTVADNIIKSVAARYADSNPVTANNGKISITVPQNVNIAEFISSIENIEVQAGTEARVVINEKDGTIVMGGDVKISGVVVSKDGMTIKIKETGETASAAAIKESSTVQDIVDSLNYIGASSRDIIAILKAIKEAGALHADLIIN